jgi:hypothetical protein
MNRADSRRHVHQIDDPVRLALGLPIEHEMPEIAGARLCIIAEVDSERFQETRGLRPVSRRRVMEHEVAVLGRGQ